MSLFETIEDLDNSAILWRSLSLLIAQKWIASKDNYQEIMLGYSDMIIRTLVSYLLAGLSTRLSS